MYQDSKMNKIQQYELDVFCEFKRICERHGLRYFAIGGTCIGAVRHKGFIPWDDDIDVAMPYCDYIKFITAAGQELSDKYSVFGPDVCKHYSSCYIKLQNNETTMIEADWKDYPDRYTGAFIDIFPVYGLPGRASMRQLILLLNEFLGKLNMVRRFPLKQAKSAMKKIAWTLLSPVKLFVPYNYFTSRQERMLKKYPYDDSDLACFSWRKFHLHPNGDFVYKQIFPKSIFAETIEVPFENEMMSIPKRYDSYLTREFGDYMTPPPEDARVGGHKTAIIDFERSYKEYAKEGLQV